MNYSGAEANEFLQKELIPDLDELIKQAQGSNFKNLNDFFKQFE